MNCINEEEGGITVSNYYEEQAERSTCPLKITFIPTTGGSTNFCPACAEKDREIEGLKAKFNDSTVFEQLREQQAEIDNLKKELHRISNLYQEE